jgi:hypothetical protein
VSMLKGTVSRDFRPLFFFITWAPDSKVKAFLHMDSNLRSYSTKSVPQGCHGHRWTPRAPPQPIQLCKLGSNSYRTGGVIDIAGVGDIEFERLRLPLKEISLKKLRRQIVLPYSYNNHTQNIGVI